ncbi:MAG: hypothetical protein GWN62_13985 [Aliifodinibius sp.]|nr:hypothetical protein [Fodinibius sp.]
MKTTYFKLYADELSWDAFKTFKKLFKKLGVHLGDVEVELFGESVSDKIVLYLSEKRLTKKELKNKLNTGKIPYQKHPIFTIIN